MIKRRFQALQQKDQCLLMYKTTLTKMVSTKEKRRVTASEQTQKGKVYLFCDEFTNYNDTEIGIKAILLLEKLGYEVIIPDHEESGRAWLSKGIDKRSKKNRE